MPDFIIDVWRATTLADDAASFVSTVARRLSQRVALQRIALWRVDRPSRSLVTVAAAEERSVSASLVEPFSAALPHGRRLVELSALRDAAEAGRQELLRRLGREAIAEEIIGARSGLKPVMDRVAVVARADLPVLIF